MRYAPYEFKPSDAYDFARHVGILCKERGDELFFKTCPYCKPRATRGNVNTFSINLKTGQHKCLRASCGVSGNMITLARDFDFSLGTEIDEYYAPKKKYRELPQPKEPVIPKPEALQYLESRGISEEVAKRYEITVQTKNPNILVFPFYDEVGKLKFVKYRKTDFDKTKDANKEWCESKTKPILFGMKQCDTSFKRLVIVEGQMDCLAVATAGINNVVSVPTGAKGFTWVPYCWNWLCKWEEIIVFGDYEKGSISLLDELSKRLKTKIKHVREENYLDCKDANEILLKYGKEQVIKCVENAIPIPVENVIDLADVKDVDPYSLEKIPTRIQEVDKLLCGGLIFGCVNLITGKSGKGKSTLASQILGNAIDCGYNVFAYSGELPNFLFKSAIDFQSAGPQNVIEENRGEYVRRYVRKSAKEEIEEWYRGKCMLYDRTMVNDEDTDLLKTIEQMIISQNVRVILIDNLMTMISQTNVKGSKLDSQSNISHKLEDMARFYNVCIILVAHKRKDSGIDDEDMDDSIRGDSDIVNSAGVIIHYNVNKDEVDMDEFPRIIAVTKNRVFGRTNYNGWKVKFDEKSKRIYGNNDDPDYLLGWNKSDGFVQTEYEESPFT
jgi:archaellum biogenesis ATPase FlaH|nr:MAG TPA: DNA directed DNA polymerase [Caudoviricetes sp.]